MRSSFIVVAILLDIGGGTRRPRPAGKAVGAPPRRGGRFAPAAPVLCAIDDRAAASHPAPGAKPLRANLSQPFLPFMKSQRPRTCQNTRYWR